MTFEYYICTQVPPKISGGVGMPPSSYLSHLMRAAETIISAMVGFGFLILERSDIWRKGAAIHIKGLVVFWR